MLGRTPGRIAAVALIGVACAAGALAQPGSDLVQARLVAEDAAAIPGATVRIAVVFDIAPEWHLYWRNPGDTGVSPTVVFDLPDGARAGAIAWPAPERYIHGGGALLDYTHSGRMTLVVPLHIDADAEPGTTLTISADAEWLVCKEACIPGGATVSLSLPIGAPGAAPDASDDRAIFEAFDNAAPQSFDAAQSRGVQASWTGANLTITAPDATSLVFYPDEPRVGGPKDPIAGCVAEGARLVLEYGATAADAGRVTGVLEVRGGPGAGLWEISVPAPPAG
jgi:thiol:disulfide interchange protein DsbD